MNKVKEHILFTIDAMFVPMKGHEKTAKKELVSLLNVLCESLGDCDNCDGKGYTVDNGIDQESHGETKAGTVELCNCRRGKQLWAAMSHLK